MSKPLALRLRSSDQVQIRKECPVDKSARVLSCVSHAWATIGCSPPLLRYRNGVGDPVSTDTHVHDRGLDLRPATSGGSGHRLHAPQSDGLGLFHSVQHGSYRRLRLSLRPSHLSSRVARLCGMARRRPRLSDLRGWFESCYASYFGEIVWGPSGCKRSGDQWTLQIRPPPNVSLVHSGRHRLQPAGMEFYHLTVGFGRFGGSRLPHLCRRAITLSA